MTVIIRPGDDQSMRELLADVSQVLGRSAQFGFGGVVLSETDAHTYLSHRLGVAAPADAAPPAKKTAAKKTTAARGRTARSTGE